MRKLRALWLVTLPCLALTLHAQSPDSVQASSSAISHQSMDKISSHAAAMNKRIVKQTSAYLDRLARLDARLTESLKTENASVQLPAPVYDRLKALLMADVPAGYMGKTYIGHLDTLVTSLRFAQGLGSSAGGVGQAATQLSQLQAHIDVSTTITQYLVQRQQEWGHLLDGGSKVAGNVSKEFAQFQSTGYYYRQQVEEYKKALSDPQRAERLLVTQLGRYPGYQNFIASHSLLASLFQLPPGEDPAKGLAGLQTRQQVEAVIKQQAGGAGGMAAATQKVENGQAQLDAMRSRVANLGSPGQEMTMPDFKPNQQKTKTLWGRMSYGLNLQLAPSSTYFPATANVGLSLGYKLNDNSTVGVGGAYSAGLGTGWNHVRLSSQGLSLRSFLDWKIKKSFYVMGGYERNYLPGLAELTVPAGTSNWQSSALIGLEKKYRVSAKLQGSLQLLFDALYSQQRPASQPIKFRVGYNF